MTSSDDSKNSYFNPLPPHGGRLPCSVTVRLLSSFQSTPSAWRETSPGAPVGGNRKISIHSLRMEGDLPIQQYSVHWCISIHSLRMEGDYTHLEIFQMSATFQSTPSAWRETPTPWHSSPYHVISIHSLRMEGDSSSIYILSPPMHISIHSLRMEGDPLAQRAEHNPAISIHSLRMEGDFAYKDLYMASIISIHSLRMEGDSRDSALLMLSAISIHSLRMEGDSHIYGVRFFIFHFNPLPPHGGRRR